MKSACGVIARGCPGSSATVSVIASSVVGAGLTYQGWVIALHLLGFVLALLLVAETFRREPMWPRPEKGPSPRQRRWLGVGLLFVTAGGIVSGLNMAGQAELGLAAFVLPVLGLVAIIVSVVKGPTDTELERRARLLDGAGGSGAG